MKKDSLVARYGASVARVAMVLRPDYATQLGRWYWRHDSINGSAFDAVLRSCLSEDRGFAAMYIDAIRAYNDARYTGVWSAAHKVAQGKTKVISTRVKMLRESTGQYELTMPLLFLPPGKTAGQWRWLDPVREGLGGANAATVLAVFRWDGPEQTWKRVNETYRKPEQQLYIVNADYYAGQP